MVTLNTGSDFKQDLVFILFSPIRVLFEGRRGFVCQDPNQLQIDAGQKRGPTLCLTCGVVYTIG